MPDIRLKPRSPEFADDTDTAPQTDVLCDMPGCNAPAPHRAPKDRMLEGYYNFCLEHVQEYNSAWNFFNGLSASDIEDHVTRDFYGHRPTWERQDYAEMEKELHERIRQVRGKSGEQTSQSSYRPPIDPNTPEAEAMGIMGLEPPLSLEAIKIRYRDLAKQYHPDLNGGDSEAEEQLKRVNMAYTILKVAYEKFESVTTQNENNAP